MAKLKANEAAEFLLAGAIVGLAVTLLRVTQDSKVTRSGSDRLEILQGTIRDQVSGWIEEMADIVRSGTDGGKKLTLQGYERVFEGFDTAKLCLDAGRNHLESALQPLRLHDNCTASFGLHNLVERPTL